MALQIQHLLIPSLMPMAREELCKEMEQLRAAATVTLARMPGHDDIPLRHHVSQLQEALNAARFLVNLKPSVNIAGLIKSSPHFNKKCANIMKYVYYIIISFVYIYI